MLNMAASNGRIMYWEPDGYCVPLHVMSDKDYVATSGTLKVLKGEDALAGGEAYAIVKANELVQAVPFHPYVVFMELYRQRKPASENQSSELLRYRAHMLEKMMPTFQERVDDPGEDRWKDLTMADLSAMTLYICDHWEEMGLYVYPGLCDMEQCLGVPAADWFKAWRNCMCEDIWPIYMDQNEPETYDIKRFVDAWMTKHEQTKAAPQEQASGTESEPVPEVKRVEPIVMRDFSMNDKMLGPRKFHNIQCQAKLRYIMQFDEAQSTLEACTRLLGLEGRSLGPFDAFKVGPDNFISAEADVDLMDTWPPQTDSAKLDDMNAQVGKLYEKLVTLVDTVAETKEALSADVIH